MTSLEKAKRFIQKTACKTGLLILPLAAATVSHAGTLGGPTLPSGGASCALTDSASSGSCAGGAFNFGPLGPGGLVGVSLFTSGSVSFGNGDTATLILSATGPLFGGSIPTGTVIPLSYDFDLDFTNGEAGATVSGWTLDFKLYDGADLIGDSGKIAGVPDDPEVGQNFFDNTPTMTTSSPALVTDILTEQVTLQVSWSPGDVSNLTIDVPVASSFDYNDTDLASVPEPGTLGLTGSVLGIGAFCLRRRKRQS
jgi:hypothetical protein